MRGLSEEVFGNDVQPVLMARCAGCHQPFGLGENGFPNEPENPDFRPSRLVLTGSTEGDFNVSVSLVNNVCDPSRSYLLAYPTSDELALTAHPRVDDTDVVDDPAVPTADDRTVLIPGEADYQVIFDWIAAGDCPT
jgi:hypothetical protein